MSALLAQTCLGGDAGLHWALTKASTAPGLLQAQRPDGLWAEEEWLGTLLSEMDKAAGAPPSHCCLSI